MAKKKVIDRFEALKAAKEAHQFDVGAGGSVYSDPDMSNVRGVAMPSVALMEMLGFTALRDSCTVLIDGVTGSSKSSLALEIFNWLRPYAGTGSYFDGENKSAVDIGNGMLDVVHLWHPSHKVAFITSPTVEEIQRQSWTVIKQCRDANKDMPRDMQIPFLCVIDPLSATPSEENVKRWKSSKHEGATDRGSIGRHEALLWSQWIKMVNCEIVNLPFILVVVNHLKEKQEQKGANTVHTKYNPGGVAQNFATTIQLRCKPDGYQKPGSAGEDSYQDIKIRCAKSSRGPTGIEIVVRKFARRMPDGRTLFWWDWHRATAVFLAGFTPRDPVRDVFSVVHHSENSFSCKELGFKEEPPAVIGKAIHDSKEVMDKLHGYFHWKRVKEYSSISPEDYDRLTSEAEAARTEHYAEKAKEEADA